MDEEYIELLDDDFLDEAAKSFVVQKHQLNQLNNNSCSIRENLLSLDELNNDMSDELDRLLKQAESMVQNNDLSEENSLSGNDIIALTSEEIEKIEDDVFRYEPVQTITADDNWNNYLDNIDNYINGNNIIICDNVMDNLLSKEEQKKIIDRLNEEYSLKNPPHCDKIDYGLAALSGIICGLIDVFFVGMPAESKLGNWTDRQVDQFVGKFSKTLWKIDSKKRNSIINKCKFEHLDVEVRNQMLKDAGIPYNQSLTKQPETLQQCIQYLEKKFNVNYDARTSADLLKAKVLDKGHKMTPSNHHLKSLSHSLTPLGLIFSIVDQFAGKTSIAHNGRIYRFESVSKKYSIDEFELRGTTFTQKLVYGFVNWIGHIISDLAGSNNVKADKSHVKRGAGIPAPLMEVLQLCQFDLPDKKNTKMSVSDLAMKMYENGFDARFAATQAIPVVLNDFVVRFLYILKYRFYNKYDWRDLFPTSHSPELRRMLLVSEGALCTIDGIDALIKSGNDLFTFSMRLNHVAWSKFGLTCLYQIRSKFKENCIDVVALDEDMNSEWIKLYNNQF